VPEGLMSSLAGIIVVGIAAQWLAWRLRLPSILLLLGAGIIVGPVTGWIDPDALFGDLLSPIVSLSVALILYEGGLTLKLSELPRIGGVVRNLITVGAAVTWSLSSVAAHFIFGLDWALSSLLGAVLVVTGPTVIAPLLRHIRPTGDVGPALRWEGIVIDPVGALLTLLIFEVILIGEAREAAVHVGVALLKTVAIGGGLGFVAAWILVVLIERYWIADHLQSAVSLMLVVASFAVSNHYQHESGLLAVTVMGLVLANQKRADIKHIAEFKENLQVLLISILFIALAARIELKTLTDIAGPGLLFVAALVLIIRPISVYLATLRSQMSRPQRIFIAFMAPRGIVAAAVASVLALRLEDIGYEGAAILVPVTFLTIITTVAVYGLGGPILARKLAVAEADPQGVLFVGAQSWVRDVAMLLQKEGFRVLLVDSNRNNIAVARMAGLPTHCGSILAENTADELELGGLGRLLALTPNDWVNILAVERFKPIFGRAECYQVQPQPDSTPQDRHAYMRGRPLFTERVVHGVMERHHIEGYVAKATRLSEEFDYDAFRDRYGPLAVPLFVIDDDHSLRVVTSDTEAAPESGDTLICFVRDDT
jgi:NhaP-type Na+/H+ or K+/H+ antiporter